MALALILSSHVAGSRVGGFAQALALAQFKVDAMVAPTVLYGRHPGWGPPGGAEVPSEAFEGVLDGIDANGLFGMIDVVLCGYSFGADVSLTVDHRRVVAWIGVAPPLAIVPIADMVAATDPRPTHLLVAEHDQFDPPDVARTRIEGWTNTTMAVIAGADHFLGGALDRVVTEVGTAMSRTA